MRMAVRTKSGEGEEEYPYMLFVERPGEGAAMRYLARPVTLPLIIVVLLAGSVGSVAAQELPQPICDLVIHDELSELGDARIAVSLARSEYTAYLKIYEMIEGLWKAEAIGRMTWVEAKHDRDAAAVALEEADLLLERQAVLVDQYRMICDSAGTASKGRSKAMRAAYLRYRKADCDALSKKIEVAKINLEYQREFRASILDLHEGNVATKADVILAELEVELQEKTHADARLRAETCFKELAGL